MSELAETILAYFEQQGWPVQQHQTEPLFRLEYGNEVGNWTCLVWYRDELSQVVVYSVYPTKAPVDRIAEISDFINRINFHQLLGGFELNMDDGEIRYRTSVDFGRAPVSIDLLDPAIKVNLLAYGDHLSGLEDVITGRSTAREAADRILAAQPDMDFRDTGRGPAPMF